MFEFLLLHTIGLRHNLFNCYIQQQSFDDYRSEKCKIKYTQHSYTCISLGVSIHGNRIDKFYASMQEYPPLTSGKVMKAAKKTQAIQGWFLSRVNCRLISVKVSGQTAAMYHHNICINSTTNSRFQINHLKSFVIFQIWNKISSLFTTKITLIHTDAALKATRLK